MRAALLIIAWAFILWTFAWGAITDTRNALIALALTAAIFVPIGLARRHHRARHRR